LKKNAPFELNDAGMLGSFWYVQEMQLSPLMVLGMSWGLLAVPRIVGGMPRKCLLFEGDILGTSPNRWWWWWDGEWTFPQSPHILGMSPY